MVLDFRGTVVPCVNHRQDLDCHLTRAQFRPREMVQEPHDLLYHNSNHLQSSLYHILDGTVQSV